MRLVLLHSMLDSCGDLVVLPACLDGGCPLPKVSLRPAAISHRSSSDADMGYLLTLITFAIDAAHQKALGLTGFTR